MGVSWEDETKVAHAVLVTPDGRIVCQKASSTVIQTGWQATAYRVITQTTKDDPIDAASYIIGIMFRRRIPRANCSHVLSYFSELVKKRLEIVVCRIQTRENIVVPYFVNVSLMKFSSLVEKAKNSNGFFTADTTQVINLLDKMTSFGRE